ncbi:MAG: FadR family transcriptional regulator, partial [Spirochaetales bacterium]|nr:FadR family transcriptional regulator [Spirochaetales bacterium]
MDNKIEPIKKRRLSEEVLKKLQSMIIDGTYKTGDQLPSERELSELFQVSRASIREALRVLGTLGFLDSRVGVGGGTFVKKISIDALINPFSEILGNEKELIIEMLEFRRILETEIARLAALRRTEEDIARMESSLDLMREDIKNGGIG